jgi:hypothetical protein
MNTADGATVKDTKTTESEESIVKDMSNPAADDHGEGKLNDTEAVLEELSGPVIVSHEEAAPLTGKPQETVAAPEMEITELTKEESLEQAEPEIVSTTTGPEIAPTLEDTMKQFEPEVLDPVSQIQTTLSPADNDMEPVVVLAATQSLEEVDVLSEGLTLTGHNTEELELATVIDLHPAPNSVALGAAEPSLLANNEAIEEHATPPKVESMLDCHDKITSTQEVDPDTVTTESELLEKVPIEISTEEIETTETELPSISVKTPENSQDWELLQTNPEKIVEQSQEDLSLEQPVATVA